MKEKRIKVLKVAPKMYPEAVYLDNELKALQEAVSIGADYVGLIEIVELDKDICILCNEEGKLIGLEPNRRLGDDILCGVFYVTGQDKKGNLASLSDESLARYKRRFAVIEDISADDVNRTLISRFFVY